MPSSSSMNKENRQAGAGPGPLPEEYGTTMAALLPRDPEWMYAYWEIAPDSKARISREHGQDVFEKARTVLRVYGLGPARGRDHFDIPVAPEAKSWYIRAEDGVRDYYCELGLALPDGRFVGIVKTNTVRLPAGRVSDVMDEKWMSVSPDFEKLLQLSGVEYIGKGSGEVARSLAQRWEMLRAVFSRAASWGVSSLAQHARGKAEEKNFRLAADCELILYGATEPDASVTVSGRKVKLNPDGTFSMRFALPDGDVVLPIKAMSKDETDLRWLKIRVMRATEKGDNGENSGRTAMSARREEGAPAGAR